MTKTLLSTDDLTILKALGDILVPASEAMPGFSAVAGIDHLLRVAAAACEGDPRALMDAIRRSQGIADLAAAKAFSEAAPGDFDTLARVISGAYYMAPEVLVALKYPLERRNPAGVSDFADEYMTGIVDPVIENNRGAF